jgi:hypothetical protein
MADKAVGLAPTVSLKIEGGEDFSKNFESLEWASFINSGYIVRARVVDPFFSILRDRLGEYLEGARKEPTPLEFQIAWPDNDPTQKRICYLAYLNGQGTLERGKVEFLGIDPPSWWLNAGDSDGSAWGRDDGNGTESGRVSDVIKSVIKKYTQRDKNPQKIEVDVTQTNDSEENTWWMMKMDPKTFIASLLEWSSSITPQKSAWVVASVDRKIVIKEQASMPDSLPVDKKDFGIFNVNTSIPGSSDVKHFEILANNVISVFQTKLITQGISAVSGQFIDKITEEKKSTVDDENTSAKLNVSNLGPDRAFKKPESDIKWSTSIRAIPEFSAGDLGIQYVDYLDGRARTMFMDMLNMVMRIKIRVNGDRRFDDSTILGASTLTLSWKDACFETPYFLSGKWIIYGFHHIVTRRQWWTDLYLYRLDYDAEAKKI